MRLQSRLLLGVASLGASLFALRSDASEASDLLGRVREEWAKRGIVSQKLASRFLLDDEALLFRMPDRGMAPCGSLVAIGPRTMSFALQDALDNAEEARVASVGGVAAIGTCDAKRLARVRVTASAGRGAIEFVFTAGPTAAPPVSTWVPERTGTVVFLPQDPGSPPALPLLAERVASAERRARVRGGVQKQGQLTELSAIGGVDWNVVLEPGCHRFDVLGEARAGSSTRHELDAELREPEDGRSLVRDRTDSADARLEHCVGEETQATVAVSGSANAKVNILHHVWILPPHLPEHWGAPLRARIATLLHARSLSLGRGRIAAAVRGISGRTHFAQPVRRGSCYVAIVASEGEPGRGLGLRAQVGGVDFADERGVLEQAAAVTFCAGRQRLATFEVESRGSGSAWMLMLIEAVEGAWSFER